MQRLAALIVCFQFGCGAGVSNSTISDARIAVEAAELEQAEEYATYEYITAVEYLDKAREEWAYSEFQHAESYAQFALEMARAAIERAIANPNRNAPGIEYHEYDD
jgi:hypothetical protein